MLAVPLVARGKLVGSIALMSTNPSRLYGPWDVHLAEALAERAALSLESARLYRDAQQAITLREEVLAIVSHDLKNPLTTIAMVGQMLTRTLPDDRAKLAELANRIERSAGIMQKLISDLLDLSKIQGGALSIDAHPEKFREVSAPVIDVLSAQANAKGVRFEISIPSDLPDVLCDRSRVGQVLSNLLGNAIKFTPAGGLVRLSVHEGDDDVEVSVSDTGPGIKPDELPKLFEPFWQGAEARTLGAGLGLTIAHGIVVAHGGRIWAESELGAGSTFRFTLPTAHVSTPVRRL
jgi:signal transduction histidine kinase